MNLKQIQRQQPPEYIQHKITLSSLDALRESQQISNKISGAEHCFRVSEPWYQLNVGYTNPYNLGEVHAELNLLHDIMYTNNFPTMKEALLTTLKNRELVYYGIGVGDTEIAFVDWLLKQHINPIAITGIDVNEEFLINFHVALQNRLIEEPSTNNIHYRGYHALFEQINKEDLNSNFPRKIHICVGGTIGNFADQNKIMQLFSKLASTEDALLLGVQLDTHIDILFEKYKENPLYKDFVLNYLPSSERVGLQWQCENGVITAIHQGVEVFRTKKYNPSELRTLVCQNGFVLLEESIDKQCNICLQLYIKNNKPISLYGS